jgi:hypothetical protein
VAEEQALKAGMEQEAYASERARLIFDIRPGIPPVRSKARADASSDFVEGDVIGVTSCLF